MIKYIVLLSFLFAGFLPLQAQQNCVKGNCIDGQGTMEFPGGARYIGDFAGGKMHGKGILYFADGSKYIGNWHDQERQGKGRMVLANGDEYFGIFKAGKYHGDGKMTYANGNTYEGQWREGQPDGRGVFVFQTRDRYEGDLKAGLFSGQGTFLYADGSKYVGDWLDNRRHGQGTLFYANGDKISGQWERDQYMSDWDKLAFNGDINSLRNCNEEACPTGKGKFTYPDGAVYYGDFVNNMPEGIGSVVYATGDRYDGGWQRHAPYGRGVMHYASGKVVGAIWERGIATRQLFMSEKAPNIPTGVEYSPEVKIWAVVIGAARYTHMPVLSYTDDDAYQLFAFLKSPEGGALPDNQIRLLIDEDATHQGIVNAMRSVFLRADENDMILFYFSGHGLEGAFLPVDYDGRNNLLEHEQIRDLLSLSQAKHKLILADACHSGSLLAARAPLHITVQDYYKALDASKGGMALLLSSKGEEYSLEDRGLRSGIFSHFLIRGLKGEANTDGDKMVTIRELFYFVHQRVRQYTGNVQTPTLTGAFDENMPVSAIRY